VLLYYSMFRWGEVFVEVIAEARCDIATVYDLFV
jgi:hypothetical protein